MIVCCWKYFNNFALLHSVHCAFSIIILYTDIPRYTLSLIGYLFSSNIHDVDSFTMENICRQIELSFRVTRVRSIEK